MYVHVFQWNGDTLTLRPLKEKVLEAVALTGGAVTLKQTDRDVTLSLAWEHQDPIVTLIKLTLDRTVSEIQSAPAVITQIVPDPDGTIVMRPDAAETTGSVKAERRLDVPNLGHWTNPKGTVSWQIDIASPGRYAVKAETASPYSGVRFTVAVGNRSMTGETPNKGSHDSYVDHGTVEFPNVENGVGQRGQD
ncbi:MAG: hypothetical protein NTY19_41605 [Planctomycetota bacterium]|nr:hypothetical protein [Planctomycetota bacterium]